LPDTFASRTAAVQDAYADASIGNILGSNSVNVFLGLGLPWAVGAVYWQIEGQTPEWQAKYAVCTKCADSNMVLLYPDGGFVVPAGDISFSVIVFTACSLTCLFTLVMRRIKFGGELGGPSAAKYTSGIFLVSLWLVYISLSWWKAEQV